MLPPNTMSGGMAPHEQAVDKVAADVNPHIMKQLLIPAAIGLALLSWLQGYKVTRLQSGIGQNRKSAIENPKSVVNLVTNLMIHHFKCEDGGALKRLPRFQDG